MTDTQEATGGARRPDPARGRPPRRSRATTAEALGVVAITAFSAVLAVVASSAEPTGGAIADGLLRAAVAAFTVVAASRARRRTLVVAAGIAAIGCDGWDVLAGVGALLLTLDLAVRDRRGRLHGAMIGSLLAWGTLHLVWPASPFGATALLAGIALLPVWVSGYTVARSGTRRIIRRVALALAVVMVIGAVSAAVIIGPQQQRVRSAAEDTGAAARQVGAGRSDDAVARFRASATEFRSVSALADSMWLLPARSLPVVGPNLRAISVASAAGASLTTVAGELAAEVDLDSLRFEDGSVDLARLSDFRTPLSSAADEVAAAHETLGSADSGWLVEPLATELLELRAEVERARRATRLAQQASTDLPVLLGDEAPRRYLLLLGNPAEARDLGGHLGNWAEIAADDGRLRTVEVGEAYDLYTPAGPFRPTLASDGLPPALVEMDPTRFPQNWGTSPDLAQVARLAADLYPQARPGPPIDGVIYADPAAFGALLSLTGPVEHHGVPLDATTAFEYLTRTQYSDGEQPLRDVVRTALDRFMESQLPSPIALADAFSDVVRNGQLQFVALEDSRPSRVEVLELLGLDVPIRDPDSDHVDVLMVLSRNANPSKVDAYLHRTIDYVLGRDAGDASGVSNVVVTLDNRVPEHLDEPVVVGCARGCEHGPGSNRTELSVITPHGVSGVFVDGQRRDGRTRREGTSLLRHTVTVEIPPREQVTVVFALDGPELLGEHYELRWFGQALANEDAERVVLDDGTRPTRALEVERGRLRAITIGDIG